MKLSKRIIVLIFAGLLCMSACSTGDKTEIVDNEVKVWYAPSTIKILQDRHDYSFIAESSKLEIRAAKGEYESVQLIMTPKLDVKNYYAEIDSLKLESDSKVEIDTENVTIYTQKYLFVPKVFNANKMQPGNYPDALLPIEKAKKYKENSIEKTLNQGLWITVKVPEDQQAGTYYGNVKLTLDGKTENHTIKVSIIDALVPYKVNTKSVFLTNWQYQNGELDTSKDMFDAYTEALMDFRLSPQILVNDTKHTQEDIDYYANVAYKYALDGRLSNFSIPYREKIQTDGEYAGELNIDADLFDKYLTAIAKISIEKNFNVMEKLVTYIGIIDEPHLTNIYDRVRLVQTTFKSIVARVADRLEVDQSLVSANKAEVIASLRDTRNIITSQYNELISDVTEDWCPTFDKYHTEEDRAQYADQDEKWWYGCIVPRYPYPTYHIDDNLISSRVVSWMQADYDVVGNLYWATNVYASYSEKDAFYVPIEDYYANPERYPNVNGDGFLFYPGKKYDIDGPLSTIRLHSIRDGLEEYELLKQIESKYSEATKALTGEEFTADKLLKTLYNRIYTGTQVLTTEEIFYEVREQLLDLAEFTNSEIEAYIIDANIMADKSEYKVLVPRDTKVYQDGVELVDSLEIGQGQIFTISKIPTKTDNTINLKIQRNGQEKSLVLSLGGTVTRYSAEVLVNDLTVTNGSFDLLNASEVINEQASGKLIKLMLPATEANKYQSIVVKKIFSDVGIESDKLSVTLYNNSDRDIRFSLRFKYSGDILEHEIKTGMLKPGFNTIEIANLYGLNWKTFKTLDNIKINFGELSDSGLESFDKIYLSDIFVSML